MAWRKPLIGCVAGYKLELKGFIMAAEYGLSWISIRKLWIDKKINSPILVSGAIIHPTLMEAKLSFD
ncbi:MAG: hypothetical protein ABW148_18125 [Sedimenticola sp.]